MNAKYFVQFVRPLVKKEVMLFFLTAVAIDLWTDLADSMWTDQAVPPSCSPITNVPQPKEVLTGFWFSTP